MNTVSYYDLLRGAAALCIGDVDNIPDDEEQVIRAALSRRLGIAWDAYYWPELMYQQRRSYRAKYAGATTYTGSTLTAVSEVYFPQTGKCYQALQNMPRTVDTITRVGTTATATTSTPHLLATGDQVTISGAVETQYNITATITVTGATTFTYVLEVDPGGSATGTLKAGINPAREDGDTIEKYWAVCEEEYGAEDYDRATAYVVGDQVYYAPTDRSYQCIATAAAGFLPTNTTYFKPLTDFDRYIALEQTGETKIGDVVGVYNKSPIAWHNAKLVNYGLSTEGIQVLDDLDSVWVEFKAKTPSLTGDEFDADTVYTANLDQVYYRSVANPATFPGNMYDCITTTTAGDSPESAAAKWSIVNIPRIFQRYIEQGAYADFLVSDGMSEKRMIEDAKAEQILSDTRFKVGATQNQTRRNIVLTR